MVYETKIQKAQEVVDNFNTSSGNKVNWNQFLKALSEAGGISDETLAECSWEDLKSMGLPALIAKQVAKIFRQSDDEKPKFISPARASSMTTKDLVLNYNPSEADNPVGQRLKALSGGKRFIVFNDDGTIYGDSVGLLQELKDGYPERETVVVDSKPRQVYAVGERIDNLADINPLYPNRCLRPDGTCDQTNRSWAGVSEEIRYLVFLGVTSTREIQVTHETSHNILDIVVSENALGKITQRYPKTYVLYNRLKLENNLPTLKMSLGNSMKMERPNNPFYSADHKEY